MANLATQSISRPGDLWRMGDHRLLCGDSTVAADVARLLGTARPLLYYGAQFIDRCNQVLEIAAQPVELPNDKRVSRLKRLKTSIEARSVILWSGCLVFIDAICRDTSINQSIALQIEKLAPVCFRHPCIAN